MWLAVKLCGVVNSGDSLSIPALGEQILRRLGNLEDEDTDKDQVVSLGPFIREAQLSTYVILPSAVGRIRAGKVCEEHPCQEGNNNLVKIPPRRECHQEPLVALWDEF